MLSRIGGGRVGAIGVDARLVKTGTPAHLKMPYKTKSNVFASKLK